VEATTGDGCDSPSFHRPASSILQHQFRTWTSHPPFTAKHLRRLLSLPSAFDAPTRVLTPPSTAKPSTPLPPTPFTPAPSRTHMLSLQFYSPVSSTPLIYQRPFLAWTPHLRHPHLLSAPNPHHFTAHRLQCSSADFGHGPP
jgi:hypothetical protein